MCNEFTITRPSAVYSSVEWRVGDIAQGQLGPKPLTRNFHDTGGSDLSGDELKSLTAAMRIMIIALS